MGLVGSVLSPGGLSHMLCCLSCGPVTAVACGTDCRAVSFAQLYIAFKCLEQQTNSSNGLFAFYFEAPFNGHPAHITPL